MIIFQNQTSILNINGQYTADLGAIIVYNDPSPGTTALMNVSGDISLTNSQININFVKTLPVANQQFNLINGFGKFDYKNVATNGSWSMDNTNVDTYKVARMADNIVLTFNQTCAKYQYCYGHGTCNTNGACQCDDYYQVVANCSIQGCYHNCNNNGFCVEPGTNICQCNNGFVGSACQFPSSECTNFTTQLDCTTANGCTWSNNECHPPKHNSSNTIFGLINKSNYIIGLMLAIIACTLLF
ncbi:hypothetical protein SAMD00019534_048030 [Acytostelium subglobosum LB1]|uniref:hypothetical protein n=1 Tax=Acytostelium subglobosum LB1 TaxID=1410327 RepID=UPI000644DEE5|nr:hypothetical protein SAMD00019534_048030 [Acytostelium subglobosum LB1]GAM21628.1 hypothetical protein SAMD00019534_048030 [Acytostelium subglobosum LB1]|eukprot:XP_012755747.1 hypothetical protein SAMD00019534_048030 [Acytostelium subglobosum LB1]